MTRIHRSTTWCRRGRRLTGFAVLVVLTAVGAAPLPGPIAAPPDRAFDLNRRLEALDPARPLMYLELAEDLADGLPSGESADRALARRLYGLAGRLDPDGLAASAALGIASLTPDARIASRFRAAASLLDPAAGVGSSVIRPEVDLETAFEIAESFGEFRSGRSAGLRRLLEDPTRVRLLRMWDDALPGGVDWLMRQSASGGRNRPPLNRDDMLLMIRVELALLDLGQPSWSSLLAMDGDPAIVDLRPERAIEMLLDDDSARLTVHRGGAWREP